MFVTASLTPTWSASGAFANVEQSRRAGAVREA